MKEFFFILFGAKFIAVMEKTINLDFCKMTIYNNYVVNVMNEGINVTKKHNEKLIEITSAYFKNKPFVYITHRINSYSVDPNIYYKTAQVKNLKGFAVVSKNYKATINAKIEKMFFNKPFETFATLKEAFKWADDLISKFS